MKRWLVALLSFVAGGVVVGLAWLIVALVVRQEVVPPIDTNTTANTAPIPTITNRTSTTETTDKTELTVTTKTISETSREQYYSIKVEYPVIGGVADDIQSSINADIKNTIDDQVSLFKETAVIGEVTSDMLADPTLQSTMQGEFDTDTAFDQILSVRFFISEYFSGAAHPSSLMVPLNYDMQSGEPLTLADIFDSTTEYLDKLSDYSRELLTATLGEDLYETFIGPGTEPTRENFKDVLISDRGLIVIFQTYQVAPGAAGPQEILVPWEELESFLSAELRALL